MKDIEINDFLKKAEELKALFVLGQRVIPFLEEIFLFVKEIKPLLDDINVSIIENLKTMPNASKQLSKVSEATELATTEIMDVIDGVLYKSELIESNLNRIKVINSEKTTNPLKAYEIIQKALNEDIDIQDLIPQLSETISDIKSNVSKEHDEIIANSTELVNSIKDDSNSIMMSLQVQDITSQQIAAVNHLLETIQGKLGNILEKFQRNGISGMAIESEDIKDINKISTLKRDIAFDPNAIDALANSNKNRQNDIDEMINDAKSQDFTNSDEVSTDDINAMFSTGQSDNSAGRDDTISDVTGDEEKDIGPVSQDDIDALFG